MSKAEEATNDFCTRCFKYNRCTKVQSECTMADSYQEGYEDGCRQSEKDVAEAFARIIRGNLSGIGNGIQNMFEQLYTDITGEKMYKGFKD